MIQAKAYAAQSPETDLAPWSFERREPGEHDVQFDIIEGGDEARVLLFLNGVLLREVKPEPRIWLPISMAA